MNTKTINTILSQFKLTQKDVDSIKTESKKVTIYLNRGNGCIWVNILKKVYSCTWQNSWHKERASVRREALEC